MRTWITGLMVGAMIAGSAASAMARVYANPDDVAGKTPFGDFLVTPGHLAALAQIAAAEDKVLGRFCEAGYQIEMMSLRIGSPITMDNDAEAPSAGHWYERFRANGCGRSTVYNAIVSVANGAVQSVSGGPGTTALGLDLARDLRPAIVPKATIENCADKKLLDTAAGAPQGYEPKQPGGNYDTWTVTGCGRSVEMILLVNPKDDGSVSVSIEAQRPATQ